MPSGNGEFDSARIGTHMFQKIIEATNSFKNPDLFCF
jgi:hypothetical protein